VDRIETLGRPPASYRVLGDLPWVRGTFSAICFGMLVHVVAEIQKRAAL
jgi:hypothetical protein